MWKIGTRIILISTSLFLWGVFLVSGVGDIIRGTSYSNIEQLIYYVVVPLIVFSVVFTRQKLLKYATFVYIKVHKSKALA